MTKYRALSFLFVLGLIVSSESQATSSCAIEAAEEEVAAMSLGDVRLSETDDALSYNDAIEFSSQLNQLNELMQAYNASSKPGERATLEIAIPHKQSKISNALFGLSDKNKLFLVGFMLSNRTTPAEACKFLTNLGKQDNEILPGFAGLITFIRNMEHSQKTKRPMFYESPLAFVGG